MSGRDRTGDLASVRAPIPERKRRPNTNNFLAQVQNIKVSLEKIRSQTAQLTKMNQESLSGSLDDSERRISRLQDEIQDLIRNTQNSIKQLTTLPGETAQIKSNQQKLLAKRLMEVAKEFQIVQSETKKSQQKQMERQIKISNPNATEDEIRQAMNGNMRVLQTSQKGMQEAQVRQHELQKIERSIEELYNLFQDMQLLLDTQEENITLIDRHVDEVVIHLEDSSKQLTSAIDHAKSARKKKWICCIIFIILLIIIIIVVYFYAIKPALNSSSSTSSAPPNHT